MRVLSQTDRDFLVCLLCLCQPGQGRREDGEPGGVRMTILPGKKSAAEVPAPVLWWLQLRQRSAAAVGPRSRC